MAKVDFPCYEKNPSIPLNGMLKGITHVNSRIDGSKVTMVKAGTDEAIDQYTIPDTKKKTLYDNNKFVKVFDDLLPELYMLSSVAMKLMVYIWRNLKKDSDIVVLNARVITDEFKYKRTESIRLGINELLSMKVIYRKIGNDEYFINVEYYFRGKRTNLEPLVALQARLDGKS